MTETTAAEALPSALIVAGAWHEPDRVRPSGFDD
jgi:hypothetical protein